jgi:hypothetical protein
MARRERVAKLLAVAIVLALAAVLWGRGDTPRAHAVFYDTDGDGHIDIEEQLSGSDPNNPSSLPEDIGLDLLFGGNTCSDGIDNNGDGLIDSADPGCQDTDHDFISNAMEIRLGSDPNDASSTPESSKLDAVFAHYGLASAATCSDGVDNNHNGLTDAADPNCVQISNDGDPFSDETEKLFGSDPNNPNSVPEHELANPGSCHDGIDNDLDGLIDSADPGCQAAPNDAFPNATVIGSLPYNQSEKINSATRSPTDPYSNCNSGSMTVWYSYAATTSDVLLASTAGSSFGTGISVWTPLNGRLSPVACSGSYPLTTQAHVAFRANAGQTYYLMIGGDVGTGLPAQLNFHLDIGIPPANDDFLHAQEITALPFTSTLDTSASTAETNEPSCYYNGSPSSVWYRYAPTQDTLVVADGSQSGYRTLIGVWSVGKFGLQSVGCSYDGSTNAEETKVPFVAQAGHTYYVQVSGYSSSSSSGALRLAVDTGVSPPNDNFAGATSVASFPFTDTVDTFTATSEVSDPVPSCDFGGSLSRTIWYRYAPAADGYAEADLGSSTQFGSIVAVYEGTSLSALTEVACTYAPGGKAGFAARAGHTYYAVVGRVNFSRGRFGPSAGGGVQPVPTTIVSVHIDTLLIPTCAPPSVSFTDGTGDFIGAFGPPPPGQEPPDITTVTAGDDGQNTCIRVQLAAPVAPPPGGGLLSNPPTLFFAFDTQELPGRVLTCPDFRLADTYVYVPMPSNLIVNLNGNGPRPTVSTNPAFALFDGQSMTLIVPLSALGGDDRFRFTVGSSGGAGQDCAPDIGDVVSPVGPPPGDANCDGVANSLDTALILQLFAHLLPVLPCQYAGDVNHNGSTGPIDALLILQYDSGLLPSFASVSSSASE